MDQSIIGFGQDIARLRSIAAWEGCEGRLSMFRNQWFAAVGASVLGVAISATAGAQTGSDAALVKAWKQAGAAKVAIASTPPYAFLAPSGEPQGYLIEMSQEVLKGLGVPKLTAVVTTWDAMIPGLQARQYDFLPGGMNITVARCQVVAFTVPVTAQQDALYVKPGNPKKLTGYATAVENADARVAVLAGSSQEAYALKQGVAAGQLVRVPDIQSGIAAVTGGRVDTFIVGQFSVAEPEKKGVERVGCRATSPDHRSRPRKGCLGRVAGTRAAVADPYSGQG
jgi:ABC-type amino acid transport substrate-binding protein